MPQLLEGLKLAFVTSIIMGMLVSIILTIIQAKPDTETQENQQLTKLNQTLTKINEPVVQQLENVNQTLTKILTTANQIRNDIYQRHYRFTKLSSSGQILPDEVVQWQAIQDNETGLNGYGHIILIRKIF